MVHRKSELLLERLARFLREHLLGDVAEHDDDVLRVRRRVTHGSGDGANVHPLAIVAMDDQVVDLDAATRRQRPRVGQSVRRIGRPRTREHTVDDRRLLDARTRYPVHSHDQPEGPVDVARLARRDPDDEQPDRQVVEQRGDERERDGLHEAAAASTATVFARGHHTRSRPGLGGP